MASSLNVNLAPCLLPVLKDFRQQPAKHEIRHLDLTDYPVEFG